MEGELLPLSEILNELDKKNYDNYEKLEPLLSSPGLLLLILQDFSSSSNPKLLRQLLEYFPQSVLDHLMTNPSFPAHLIQSIKDSGVTYDNIWLLQELLDERYLELINAPLLETFVNSLGTSEETLAVLLIKLLNHIAFEKLEVIMKLPNSRYFGEMILFRINRATGIERKFCLRIVEKILEGFEEFFYINDLKILCDIVLDIIGNKEEDRGLAYCVLEKLLKVKEFFKIGYMFQEILEVINAQEDNAEINSLQLRILTQIAEDKTHNL